MATASVPAGFRQLAGAILLDAPILASPPSLERDEYAASLEAIRDGRAKRFDGLLPYDAPAGKTDAAPFVLRGYPCVSLCCIDPAQGVPANYHRMSDTFENVNFDDVARAIDATERIACKVMKRDATTAASP